MRGLRIGEEMPKLKGRYQPSQNGDLEFINMWFLKVRKLNCSIQISVYEL